MTFLGLRSSLLFSSSWWVHVRWTDGLKALPMMMALDALTDIDRADHNALHSANAPTRHRAWLQSAQACFAIFTIQCSVQYMRTTALHVFAPKYSWQTCPSNDCN